MRPCTPSLPHYGLPAAAAIAREPFPSSPGLTARVKGFRRRLPALPAARVARQSRFQDLQQTRFVGARAAARSTALARGCLHAAVEVRVKQRRMDVGFAANRFRIAERPGDGLDCGDDVALAFRERAEYRQLLQRPQREQGAGPGAKVLCGEIAAADLPQI